MIDVDKPINIYSYEELQRFPNNILVIKFNDEIIGNIQLKNKDSKLWKKVIDSLNKLKTE